MAEKSKSGKYIKVEVNVWYDPKADKVKDLAETIGAANLDQHGKDALKKLIDELP